MIQNPVLEDRKTRHTFFSRLSEGCQKMDDKTPLLKKWGHKSLSYCKGAF